MPLYDPALQGYAPYAMQINCNPVSSFTGGLTLAAAGGTVLVPMAVTAPLLLQSISVRNIDTASERTWEARVYRPGQAADIVFIAGTDATETFTASAASTRTANVSGAPVLILPGVVWLAVRCSHATNSFSVGVQTTSTALGNTGQTKTLGSSLGATLDAVAATWTAQTSNIGVRLNGRAFGQTSAF